MEKQNRYAIGEKKIILFTNNSEYVGAYPEELYQPLQELNPIT